MPSKEQVTQFIDFLKLQKDFEVKSRAMMQEVTNMFEEINLDKKGYVRFEINVIDDKVVIGYDSLVTNKSINIYESKGFEIMWDTASWEIAKREIKDILYDVRKNMKDKAEVAAAKPLTLWEKIKRFFTP